MTFPDEPTELPPRDPDPLLGDGPGAQPTGGRSGPSLPVMAGLGVAVAAALSGAAIAHFAWPGSSQPPGTFQLPFSYSQPNPLNQSTTPTPTSATTSVTLYSGSGLTILANCDTSGNASLQANGPASADSDLTVSGYQNGGTGYYGSQTNTLGPASIAALGPAIAGEATFSYESSGGQVVTGNIGYQKAPSLGGFAGCAFFGTVISG